MHLHQNLKKCVRIFRKTMECNYALKMQRAAIEGRACGIYHILWHNVNVSMHLSLTIKNTMLVKRDKYVLIDHINMFS